MLADAVLHTGRQEDDRHFDAEASGVILLSSVVICTALQVAGVYLLRDLQTERRVVSLYSLVFIIIGLFCVRKHFNLIFIW